MSATPEAARAHALRRQYAKLCCLEDFDDPALLEAIADVVPERDPLAHVERKVWEFAMLVLFLRETGHLDDRARVLATGAGDERVLFWLANRVGHVLATDVYGERAFAGREASDVMLTDPASRAPYPYREDRLTVRSMDAAHLGLADASFDVVYSLSSMEHFGAPGEIAAAAAEMGRVLTPGGHAFVVTECFVRRHPLNAAPVDVAIKALTLKAKRRRATLRRRATVGEVFTPRELRKRIVEPSGLELMQPLDLTLTPRTWENLTRTEGTEGRLTPRTGTYYPHLLLQAGRSVYTSVCLPLRKPAG